MGKMEQENRQLKFLTTTLRQEIDALKNRKGSNPVEIKSEEVLMKDKLNTPIIDLNFTVRAFRQLSSSGCKTLGDVANLHKNTLLNMPHCGQKTIKDIEDVLEIHGLLYEYGVVRLFLLIFAWTLACLFLDDVFEMARFPDAE